MKTAVYPGSFDPIHTGHVDIIERLAQLYERVIVLVSESTQKQHLFSIDDRIDLVRQSLKHLKNVEVDSHQGLTVDYMQNKKASVIIRGLRAVVDFEYEMTMASMNKKLNKEIHTLLMFASPEHYYISSRGVKEIAKHGGELRGFVPEPVIIALRSRVGRGL